MFSIKRNIIILTAGLTGSSVVAGLLQNRGYWAGGTTLRKRDYDTFENQELVALNDRLLRETGYQGRFDRAFSRADIEALAHRARAIDPAPYLGFLRACDQHQPWLWKDPRLWLTIRFWAPLLDFERAQILLVTRQHSQAWISHILRRQIQTPSYCRTYMEGVRASFVEFLTERGLPYHEIVYEDLLLRPEAALAALGGFIGVPITLAHLQEVFHAPLRRRHHGLRDYLRAVLIYLKNYRLRAGAAG